MENIDKIKTQIEVIRGIGALGLNVIYFNEQGTMTEDKLKEELKAAASLLTTYVEELNEMIYGKREIKMNSYEKFLKENYNMESKITLADYLKSLNGRVVDIYSLDEETTEEYFGTLEKGDIAELTKKERAYKVINIGDSYINIYIGKRLSK